MAEQPETESVEIEPSDLETLAGLMDDDGNLPPHATGGVDEKEQEQPEQEAPQQEARTQEKPDAESTDSPEEPVEIEYEGAKYRVPPPLKDALLRQADYTRKTQELAREREAVQQQQRSAQVIAQQAQQFTAHIAAIQQIDGQLQQMQQVDWAKLEAADPVRSVSLRQSYMELARAREGLVGQLSQAQQQAQQQSMQSHAELVRKGNETLSKSLPGWGHELQTKLAEAATKFYGYAPEEYAGVADPRAIQMLNDARQWRELQAQQPQTAKKVQATPPKVVRPSASHGPSDAPARNEALMRLRRTHSDLDAVEAIKGLGFD